MKPTRNEAKLLMDNVLSAGKDNLSSIKVTFDSVNALVDELSARGSNLGKEHIYSTILDGVEDYRKQHGCLPDPQLVANAMQQAQMVLDDAVTSANSNAHSTTAFQQMKPLLAIRTMISTGIPFAGYANLDPATGEGSIIVVSHNAASATGNYAEGDSLNGMAGGYRFISPKRSHTLTTSDHATFTGKITPVQKSFSECDQDAEVQPLYQNTTQIYVNGLIAAKSAGKGDNETASAIVKIGDTQYTLNASVNIASGEVSVKFDKALPENTEVMVRGYLNVENPNYKTPAVKVEGEKYVFDSQYYRSVTTVTPEARIQFEQEIGGIDPGFEGAMAIRQQLQQETLFGLLDDLSHIGERVQNAQYDFNWATQSSTKTQAVIAEDLLGKLEVMSKEMAKRNGSHGVSHIYVGERMAAVLASLGDKYFEASGLTASANVYRIGRLKSLGAEVYYTPKGILADNTPEKAERMLLIGANTTQPAFNPVILGELSAPKVDPINPTSTEPTKGYWVTGRHIVEQNPVAMYASSVAVLDCINMAY